MTTVRRLVRQAKTALSNPSVFLRAATWFLSREPTLRLEGGVFGDMPNFVSYAGAWVYRPEPVEVAYISKALRGADVVIDVGANFGILSWLFHKHAPAARIYAFEPGPATRRILAANMARNHCDRVEIVAAAAADKDGVIAFAAGAEPATDRIAVGDEPSIEATALRLDQFTRDKQIQHIDFLKIDVEGAELLALRGAESLFEEGRVRRGMIEICPDNLAAFGETLDTLTGWLETRGYRLWMLDEGRGPVRADALPPGFFGNAAFERIVD